MNGNLMIGVQMFLALAEPFPQLGQNLLYWRRTQIELPEVHHHARLPAAIHTPPFIAHETKNAQLAMGGVITALRRRPATFVPPLPSLPSVNRAIRFPIAEIPASRRIARMLG